MTFINFTKPKIFDYIVLVSYILIIIFIYQLILDVNPTSFFSNFGRVVGYCIITQILILHLLYKHIRNTTFIFFWILVGVFHLYLAFILKNDYKIAPQDLFGIGIFFNTIFLVIFIQVLRYISLKVSQEEFIVPFNFAHLFDLIDQRKTNFLDKIIIFLYWVALLGLPVLWNELAQN